MDPLRVLLSYFNRNPTLSHNFRLYFYFTIPQSNEEALDWWSTKNKQTKLCRSRFMLTSTFGLSQIFTGSRYPLFLFNQAQWTCSGCNSSLWTSLQFKNETVDCTKVKKEGRKVWDWRVEGTEGWDSLQWSPFVFLGALLAKSSLDTHTHTRVSSSGIDAANSKWITTADHFKLKSMGWGLEGGLHVGFSPVCRLSSFRSVPPPVLQCSTPVLVWRSFFFKGSSSHL